MSFDAALLQRALGAGGPSAEVGKRMISEELRRLVDETAASTTNWHMLAIQLQRPPAGPNDPVPAFVAAFHYMLYPITEESGREA